MCLCTSLQTLLLKGNQLQLPPIELVEKGHRAVLMYLLSLNAWSSTDDIDLCGRGLVSFPPRILQFNKSRVLLMDNNEISLLPPDISLLLSYETMSVKKNKLVGRSRSAASATWSTYVLTTTASRLCAMI